MERCNGKVWKECSYFCSLPQCTYICRSFPCWLQNLAMWLTKVWRSQVTANCNIIYRQDRAWVLRYLSTLSVTTQCAHNRFESSQNRFFFKSTQNRFLIAHTQMNIFFSKYNLWWTVQLHTRLNIFSAHVILFEMPEESVIRTYGLPKHVILYRFATHC